jgi:NADH-quinone oxidoreductase subunit H
MLASWYDFVFTRWEGEYIWFVIAKILVIVIGLLTIAAYLTLAERKVAGHIQLRYGPNRVGPFGFMQPAADAVKLLFKENAGPSGRDRFLYMVGPSLAGGAALFAFAVIPLSAVNHGIVHGQSYAFHWDIAHLNVGLLFVFAMTSFGVYSIFLGGWSANSKYSLLGREFRRHWCCYSRRLTGSGNHRPATVTRLVHRPATARLLFVLRRCVRRNQPPPV